MNNYDKALDALDLTPYRREWCCVCGSPKTDGHHVVYRSHGGKDRHIISLCRDCHTKVHVGRIRFKADRGALWALLCVSPISIDEALRRRAAAPGELDVGLWRDLAKRARYFETEWSK